MKWNPEKKRYNLVLLEEHVLKEITDRLWLQAKIRMVRINQPVGGKVHPNENGIPDLVGCIPQIVQAYTAEGLKKWAIPLYIEVKRPGGRRSAAQECFIAEEKADGCAAFFAESWTDVIRELYPFGVKLAA